jgi:hypothetical protein
MSGAYSQVNEKSYFKQELKAQEYIGSGSEAHTAVDWSSDRVSTRVEDLKMRTGALFAGCLHVFSH